MPTPELHFGAVLSGPLRGTAGAARELEALGYEYAASGEHFMRGNPPTPTGVALPVLGVVAGATHSIRLLSSIILVPLYHPVMLAKLTATLDIASGGRLTLGVGVGGEFPMELEALGVPAKERGGRANEGLGLLQRLWTEEHVTARGKYYQFEDVTLAPRPAQEPHPPIWVAGRREAAMRRALRYGQGWLPYFYSPERYRESVVKIRALAATEGKDLSNFQWASYMFISIHDDVEEAARVAAKRLGTRFLYGGDFRSVVGSYCVLGPVSACVERIREYIEAGARHIIFSWTCEPRDTARHIETAAREIIPALRG